jgi:hypothetical protein
VVYALSARTLDRTTGLIAAVLLATLPLAVSYGRAGCEYSQVPLLSALMLYYALKPGRVGLFLTSLMAVLVYATNILLLPMVVVIYLVQKLRQVWGDPLRVRRELDLTLLGTGVLAGVVKLLTGNQSARFYSVYYRPMDWARFLHHACGFLTGLDFYVGSVSENWAKVHVLGFWGVLALAFGFGGYRLVLARRWERVALVGGLLLSVTALHVVAGSEVLGPGISRYGSFLIVPTILVVACLLESLLAPPTAGWSAAIRRLQLLMVLGLGGLMLVSVKRNWIDQETRSGVESIWTFQTDQADPKEQALESILSDIRSAGRNRPIGPPSGPALASTVIVADDWWLYRPIEYLAIPNRQLKVGWLQAISGGSGAANLRLCNLMRHGAYFVTYADRDREAKTMVLNAFATERLHSWEIKDRNGTPAIRIFRLKTLEPDAGEIPAVGRPVVYPPYAFKTTYGRLEAGILTTDLKTTAGYFVYGPYLTLPAGQYSAMFFLKGSGPIDLNNGKILIEAFRLIGPTLYAREEFQGDRLAEIRDGVRPVILHFRLDQPTTEVEFRVQIQDRPIQGRLDFFGIGLAVAESPPAVATTAQRKPR